MTRITAAIDAAIVDLEWFKIPHTVDQCIGLHAQALGDTHARRFSHGASVEQLLGEIRATDYGSGGLTDPAWSDPTCAAALRSDPADGDTVTAIGWHCTHIAEDARQLGHIVADVLGLARRYPPALPPSKQNLIEDAVAHLHAARPHVAAAIDLADRQTLDDLTDVAVLRLAENASWLRIKGEAIWDATRGASQQTTNRQPGQRPDECRLCSAWRTGTIATSRGRCAQCATFQDHHKCKPTEAIVRRWDATGRNETPPGLILEAKATGRRRARASG